MKKQLLIVSIAFLLCVSGFSGCFETKKQNETTTPDDTDGDGLSNEQEIILGTNVTNPDSDGDGVYDFFETDNGTAIDTDIDRVIDALDSDDDSDSVYTINESSDKNGDGNPTDALDTDIDGLPDYLDNDDDNDSIITNIEEAYSSEYGSDIDDDDVLNYLDINSDNDSKNDIVEGTGDNDGDGIPNFLDSDDNNGPLGDLDDDGTTNQDEGSLDPIPPDSDDDGTPDYLDPGTGGESSTEQERFIGSWHNIDIETEHLVFYGNGSLKTTSIEIDELTQEPYLYTIWSIYEVENNMVCFMDQDVPSGDQPSVCFDYEFSNGDKVVTLLVNGDVALELTRD